MLLLLESEILCYFTGMGPSLTLQKEYLRQLFTTLTSIVTMLTEENGKREERKLRLSDTGNCLGLRERGLRVLIAIQSPALTRNKPRLENGADRP